MLSSFGVQQNVTRACSMGQRAATATADAALATAKRAEMVTKNCIVKGWSCEIC